MFKKRKKEEDVETEPRAKWHQRFRRAIGNYFLTGLLVIAPLGVTYLLLKFLIGLTDSLIPRKFHPDTLLGFNIPFLGTILALLLILLVGVLARNLVGKRVVTYSEALISRIPLVRSIYQAVKQLMEAIFVHNKDSFQRAVLLEYPRRGIYSLGFITGGTTESLKIDKSRRYLNVFVPTTPNPTSGFFLVVPEEEVLLLDISVEEAFRALISAGIATSNEPPQILRVPDEPEKG